MSNLYLISPPDISALLSKMIHAAVGNDFTVINDAGNIPDLKNARIVFALELNTIGFCGPVLEVLAALNERGVKALAGAEAIVLVHSQSELYTKSAAQNVIFIANQLGCRFPGHPVIEATASLNNFLTWQKTINASLEEICLEQCAKLGDRFLNHISAFIKEPKILALHASANQTSNTLALWHKVQQHLQFNNTQEHHVENGTIVDCNGCTFVTCAHFSSHGSCFYGGSMVEEIYPAIEWADAIVWVCPNYNDAISANLMAVVNRLTALYRKTNFHSKSLFAIIVSGNSGGDSVAKQLIGALNINKGFQLPPYFTIMETANDPGTVLNIPCIEDRIIQFVHVLLTSIKS